MKNSILLMIATLISTHALAFDFTIPVVNVRVKGKDPKIIVDVVEEGKRAGTKLSNGVRDAIGYVGNATGITNIIESNKKTLSDIGTGYACIATLCYSEVVKKKQLEEAEEEFRKKFEFETANAEKNQNRLSREARVNGLNEEIRSSEVMLTNLNKQLDIIKALRTANTQTLTALNTQMIWNEAMAKQGVKDRPALASNLVRPAVIAFEDKFNRAYDEAIVELNQSLERLEASAKRARSELMADFIYTLSDSTLSTFSSILSREHQKTIQSIIELESKIRTYNARLETARATLAKEGA